MTTRTATKAKKEGSSKQSNPLFIFPHRAIFILQYIALTEKKLSIQKA